MQDMNRFLANVYNFDGCSSDGCDDCDCHSCDGSCHCDGGGDCDWG